jgi:curli biogenesis system outer membrane secretion channel CsgG
MTFIHRIVNTETGEVIERDYNKNELDEVKANQVKIDAEVNEIEAKASARAAILDRLGITADEAAILLG